ncbi:molybdopterin-dependent oxidoreductase [Nakamurella aerolata]|uniref:Molybdopterin-dependent oxidoreductase n=1 Tax=Nakamurella aerolata TaxID=1656892 RepID=A0A849A7I5_9ACTN|nr:molybdopterin-dependent oxidoreductase [Nakamurella aerolata]NNG35586.1 molybdopterin-dependent oxidoreductase [Nakamurella aerolata]
MATVTADRQGPPAAPPARRRLTAAAVGVAAVVLAIGIAELIAALGNWFGWFEPEASPLRSLGQAFIDVTPGWLANWAKETLGTADKLALGAGMALTLVLAGALVGVLTRVHRLAGLAAVLVLAVVAGWAILSRPGIGAGELLPLVLGVLAGAWLLRFVPPRSADAPAAPLDERAPDPVAVGTPDGAGEPGGAGAPVGADTSVGAVADVGLPTRREALRAAGVGTVAGAAAGGLSRLIPSTAAAKQSRAAVQLPAKVQTQNESAVRTFDDIPGISSYVTPNADFYRIDTAFTLPQLTTADWKLRIHGMVENEIVIDYPALLARPQQERMVTLTCVSNPRGGDLIGNARWQGARIDELLGQAKPLQGADCVLSADATGFTCSTPLEALTDGRDALLAVGMNGAPLPVEHGFPVRMVVPGLYGFVSATKWVVDWEVTRFDKVEAYWTRNGWSARGPIKLSSRMDIPTGDQPVSAGQVRVGGVAWAQHTGIARVQVQIDDGPWRDAEVSRPVSVDTWVQWVYNWDAAPGHYTLRCRAIDRKGAAQIGEDSSTVPDGATGYHQLGITVTA